MGNCGSQKTYGLEENKIEKQDDGSSSSSLHQGAVLHLSSLKNRRICSSSEDSTISIYDLSTRATISCVGHKKAVNRTSLAKDDNYIWSISRDLSIKMWNTENGECLSTIPDGHSLNITGLASSEDDRNICTGSRDYSVKVWDTETLQSTCQFAAPRNIVTTLEYGHVAHSHFPLIFQGSEDLCVRAWDPRMSSKYPALHITGFVYFPTCMALSRQQADGSCWLLATGCKGFDGVGCDVKVFDIRKAPQSATGCEARPVVVELPGHRQDVTGCQFLSDTIVLSASRDGTVCTWDITNPASIVHKQFVLIDAANYTGVTHVTSGNRRTPPYLSQQHPTAEVCLSDRNGAVTTCTFSAPDLDISRSKMCVLFATQPYHTS